MPLAATVLLLASLAPSLLGQERAALFPLVGRTIPGHVTTVTDGDSVRVRIEGAARPIPVRLEGIDAPERGEPFSVEARNAARVLLFDQPVEVKGTDVDRYDRLVARVLVNGQDVSLTLVRAGLACHFTRFANDPGLAAAQADARTAGRGFWAAAAPKPRCVKFTRLPRD